MAWRMTNVSIMDPAALAAQLDANTDRLYGGHQRKHNPYPKMRLTEGKGSKRSGPRGTKPSKTAPHPIPDRSEITPTHLYVVDLRTAEAKDVARKVLTRCQEARVLWPTIGGEPALPGYLVIALDHEMTDEETANLVQALPGSNCGLLGGPLPADEREQILRWSEKTEARKGA